MKAQFSKIKDMMVFVAVLLVSSDVYANDKPNSKEWYLISNATATWMWLDIYEADLYANSSKLPNDFLDDGVPLKLTLCYLRSMTPDIFIEGANQALPSDLSLQLQGEVNRLHDAYQAVNSGDCYSLVYKPNIGTQLLLNDTLVFNSKELGFKALYFGVWLGDTPLSNSLKESLVGQQ